MGKRKKPAAKKNAELQLHSVQGRSLLATIRRLAGLAGLGLILWGLSMIAQSYLLGVLVAYAGFLVLLMECAREPLLFELPYQFQIALLGLVLFLATSFTIDTVIVRAPLNVYCYAVRHGNLQANAAIAGIPWNDRFTDLRVAVTNPTSDDYEDFDLEIKPDKPTYKAAILGEDGGCKLLSIGGNTVSVKYPSVPNPSRTVTANPLGEGRFDLETNDEGSLSTLLTDGGYRLKCYDKFPAKFSIVIVFALAVTEFHEVSSGRPGQMTFMSITNSKSEFDILGDRPLPQTVSVSGKFKTVKWFQVSRSYDVHEGN